MHQAKGSIPAQGSEKAYNIFVTSNEECVQAEPRPEPVRCEYCGKTLYYRGIRNANDFIQWLFPEPCDCKGAIAHRDEMKRKADDERRAKEADEARRRKIARIEKLIGRSGMGARFQLRTFDNYECSTEQQRKCFEKARAYADEFDAHLADGTGLFIAGSVGTGKTHLAGAIAIQLLNEARPVIFRTAIDMFADIKRTFGTEISESAVLNEYKSAELLVIDDLGKERMTEWAAATLYGIVNARYENMLPIIVTTNFTSDDLLKSLGDEPTRAEAILSRLMETSAYIAMNWGDHRTGGGAHG